jgi:CRP/FNR family transcriptional regulator, anaerobic regulatory protein
MQTAVQSPAAVPVRFVRTAQAAAVEPNTSCSRCHLKDLCVPGGLDSADVKQLDTLRFARRRVKEGQPLYHEGERFQFLYAVRSGTFKSFITSTDGREQVTAFHMAGEMMGLDGLADGHHASSSCALEDAEICAIPYAGLTAVAAMSVRLQQAISRLFSREIVREHSQLMLLGCMSAEERVAAFLLNLSRRMKARGYSASEFHLRMSRAEIGSHLGLTLETVSRTFSSLQQQRLLEVDKKHVRIVDVDGLARAFEASVQ